MSKVYTFVRWSHCCELCRHFLLLFRSSQGAGLIRSCPVCRAPSHFIVPCSAPITDQRNKDLLVAAFKLNCSKKTCVTYQRDGSCPFGVSCFYRHVDECGAAAVPEKVRVRVDDEGATRSMANAKISDFLE